MVKTKQKKNVIYIMTNPSFKEYVKIGYSEDVEKRKEQLNSSTAIPYGFRIYATYDITEKLLDSELHNLIDRLNPDLRTVEESTGKNHKKRKREFYEMSPEDAYLLLQSIAKISGTENRLHKRRMTEDEQKREKEATIAKTQRRSNFHFSMVGLKPGDEVIFIKNKTIVATIVDDTHVKYGKITTSLSGLAQKLLNKKALAGPRYFTYKGKLLSDIRATNEKSNTKK